MYQESEQTTEAQRQQNGDWNNILSRQEPLEDGQAPQDLSLHVRGPSEQCRILARKIGLYRRCQIKLNLRLKTVPKWRYFFAVRSFGGDLGERRELGGAKRLKVGED